jgi:hypothetical protein
MNVLRIEETTEYNVAEHAAAIAPSVQADPELREIRPDSYDRLQTPEGAETAFRRILGSRTMNSYLMWRNQTALGVATKIGRFAIYSPATEQGPRILRGDHWDYWTTPDVSEDEHIELVRSFVGQDTSARTLLATVTAKEERRALGFAQVFEPVDELGTVAVPLIRQLLGRDYGLSAVTDPIQVYRYTRERSRA